MRPVENFALFKFRRDIDVVREVSFPILLTLFRSFSLPPLTALLDVCVLRRKTDRLQSIEVVCKWHRSDDVTF